MIALLNLSEVNKSSKTKRKRLTYVTSEPHNLNPLIASDSFQAQSDTRDKRA